MEVATDHIVTVLGVVVSAAVGWGASKATTANHESQLRALFKFKDEHSKESGDVRFKFQEDVNSVKERLAKKEAQNDEILRRLDAIDSAIRLLAERRSSNRGENNHENS